MEWRPVVLFTRNPARPPQRGEKSLTFWLRGRCDVKLVREQSLIFYRNSQALLGQEVSVAVAGKRDLGRRMMPHKWCQVTS